MPLDEHCVLAVNSASGFNTWIEFLYQHYTSCASKYLSKGAFWMRSFWFKKCKCKCKCNGKVNVNTNATWPRDTNLNQTESLLKIWQTHFVKFTKLYKILGVHLGAFINDVTQIWPKIDHPPPSVTLKWLFQWQLYTECHTIQYPPLPYLLDVIYEWSLSEKYNYF